MNWDLIVGAGSVAVPIAFALWKWGTSITKFMASTEQRITQLEKAENTVCRRLDQMEERQAARHEKITKTQDQLTRSIASLREELVSTNSIRPNA
jgi:hypothetical protein